MHYLFGQVNIWSVAESLNHCILNQRISSNGPNEQTENYIL